MEPTNKRTFHIDHDGQWRPGPRPRAESVQDGVKWRLATASPSIARTPVQRRPDASLPSTTSASAPSTPAKGSAESRAIVAPVTDLPVNRYRYKRRFRRRFTTPSLSFVRRWVSQRRRHAPQAMRTRDIAVFGMAAGLAVGAIALALVHNFRTQVLDTPVLDRTPPAWLLQADHAGPKVSFGIDDQVLTHESAQADALVFPRFTSLMYEGGVFDSYQHAVATAKDYIRSGVASYPMQTAGVTTLLLGPTLSPKKDQAFVAFLDRAQVPYFVRSFSAPEWTVPVPGLPAQTDAHLEGLITSDLQVLQGLLALRAGYAVPELSSWAAQGVHDDQLVVPLLTRLGKMGTQIAAFHASVLAAQQAMPEGQTTGTDESMRSLTKAITLYLQIGRN
ncbi:MAG: hypothetical protein OWT28_02110 [Firmicutes bacterium]|nr:hypothetical protein [Bacillota bacterium]